MPIEDYPIISGLGITQEQVDNYFENKIEPPVPPVPPTITKPKAVGIANAMFVDGVEESGGVVGIARTVHLSTMQVKAIMEELHALLAEWESSQ